MQIDLISDSSKKTSLQISLKLPRVQNRKVELLHHLRTLPTVPAMSVGEVCRRRADLVIIRFNMINVTEHSSLPSLPTPFAKWLLLSSPCRMGTAPGFSPWKLVIPHCGKPCLAFNFPINNFSQHLFARARNCRGWCHDAYSDMGRCYQLVATLTLRGNTHTQIIPNPSQSSRRAVRTKKAVTSALTWTCWIDKLHLVDVWDVTARRVEIVLCLDWLKQKQNHASWQHK